jgi:hypothetical protein
MGTHLQVTVATAHRSIGLVSVVLTQYQFQFIETNKILLLISINLKHYTNTRSPILSI